MVASHRRMLPLAAVEAVIGRAFAVRANAEQRAKGVERVEPPVKAERELIQVGLKVLRLDAPVVRASKPSLQIRENKVNDGQIFFGNSRIVSFDNGKVLVAERGKLGIARRCVGDNHRARLNGGFHKARQRLSTACRDDFKPKATSISPAAPHGLVALFGGAGADLDGCADQNLILRAATLAAHRATDVGFVNLDMIAARKIATNTVAALADHSSPQFVQDLEGSFVPAEAKLPLELHRRNAGCHAGYKIGTPKPDRQGRFRVLHNGSAHQTRVPLALAAAQDGRTCDEPERLGFFLAMRANEALGPLSAFQIGRTGRVILEKPLEVPERFREGQVFPLQNIGKRWHDFLLHNRRAKCPTNAETLAQVGLGVNRISMIHDIGWAVKQMHNGSRVRRAGWNGKGMWLALVEDEDNRFRFPDAGRLFPMLPWVGMKTADDKFVPWLCSQTDLLATDWELAE